MLIILTNLISTNLMLTVRFKMHIAFLNLAINILIPISGIPDSNPDVDIYCSR